MNRSPISTLLHGTAVADAGAGTGFAAAVADAFAQVEADSQPHLRIEQDEQERRVCWICGPSKPRSARSVREDDQLETESACSPTPRRFTVQQSTRSTWLYEWVVPPLSSSLCGPLKSKLEELHATSPVSALGGAGIRSASRWRDKAPA